MNPEIKATPDKKERTVEIYFLPLNVVQSAPKANISAKIGKNKYVNIILKLPVLMNRFILLEEVENLDEFQKKWMNNEYFEKNIMNVNKKIVSNMYDLGKLFEYHLDFAENKIAGTMKALNRDNSLLDFVIEIQTINDCVNLKFFYGIGKKLNDRETKYLKLMVETLDDCFVKILKIDYE